MGRAQSWGKLANNFERNSNTSGGAAGTGSLMCCSHRNTDSRTAEGDVSSECWRMRTKQQRAEAGSDPPDIHPQPVNSHNWSQNSVPRTTRNTIASSRASQSTEERGRQGLDGVPPIESCFIDMMLGVENLGFCTSNPAKRGKKDQGSIPDGESDLRYPRRLFGGWRVDGSGEPQGESGEFGTPDREL